jgi:hypothetical protein
MITSILFKNFRGIRERLLTFGPGVNVLRGKNELGKTAVNEAISFGFYGCDCAGSKNPDHLITYGEEACQIVITTDKASFDRIKRRGVTSTVLLTRGGIPPIKLNQTELTQLLGIPFEVFASYYNAEYFMNLPSSKQMEVLGQIAKVDRKALLSSLVPDLAIHTKIKLENLRVDLQVVSNERRGIQNQLAADQGALAQIEAQMKDFSSDLSLLGLDAVKKEIEVLSAQEDLFNLYHSDLVRYQSALVRVKEQREDNKRIAVEIERVSLEIRTLQPIPASKEIELTELLKSCSQQISVLESQKESVPSVPQFLSSIEEGHCSRCGQMVSSKLKENIEQQREKAINDYNEKARLVETRNSERLKQLEVLKTREGTLQGDLEHTYNENFIRSTKKVSLEKRLADLETKDVRDPVPPARPEGGEKVILQKLADFRARVQATQLFQQKKESLIEREKLFRISVTQKFKLVDELRRFEEALQKMPELEVQQTLELIRVSGIRMILSESEFTVTDEKLVPYSSLSTGRRLKMSLSLCQAFQRVGQRAPHFYFVDNVDLMDDYHDYLPKGLAQVMIAKVDREVHDLQVVPLGGG